MLRMALKTAGIILLLIPVIWIMASFAEVNRENVKSHPVYSEYNFFRLISGYSGEM